jgi:hypothetical protein
VVQSQVEGDDEITFVTVNSFKRLAEWLSLVADQVDNSAAAVVGQAREISPYLTSFLMELDFEGVWRKLQKNHTTSQQRLAAFHCWFDALRSRQLLTRLDAEIENLSQRNDVEELLRWGGYAGVKNEDDQLRLLEQLQGATKKRGDAFKMHLPGIIA